MSNLIESLFANNLKALNSLKLSGEFIIEKDLILKAVSGDFTPEEDKSKPKAKPKAKKDEKPALSVEQVSVILDQLAINEFNLTSNENGFSLKVDIEKKK